MDDHSTSQSSDNLPSQPSSAVRDAPGAFGLDGASVWASAMGSAAEKQYKAKVFKSGNSMALRLPKALGLEAGMEMEISVQADGTYLLKRVEPARRKIDISGFAGKCPWLKPLPPDLREFEERPSTISARKTTDIE